MNRHILFTLLIAATFLQGQDTLSHHVTDTYHYSINDLSALELNFDYGFGALTIKPLKDDSEILGSLSYQTHRTQPKVTFDRMGSTGKLKVKLTTPGADIDTGLPFNFKFDTENFKSQEQYLQSEIDFGLPIDIPSNLSMNLGMGSADLDLTGLSLRNLSMDCGLSQVKINVDKPNVESCDSVRLSNGLGDLKAYNLGNLNTHYMKLDVGLGSAYVDMRGSMKSNLMLDAEVGLGSLSLVLPEDANIRVTVDETFLSSVDISELKKIDDHHYKSGRWLPERPTINISLSVGLGHTEIDLLGRED